MLSFTAPFIIKGVIRCYQIYSEALAAVIEVESVAEMTISCELSLKAIATIIGFTRRSLSLVSSNVLQHCLLNNLRLTLQAL
jgi:hypothetical protein